VKHITGTHYTRPISLQSLVKPTCISFWEVHRLSARPAPWICFLLELAAEG